MTNKQFLQALTFMAWFMTTALLSAFSFLLGSHVPNPNYTLWIIAAVFVNTSCATYWFSSYIKQGDIK